MSELEFFRGVKSDSPAVDPKYNPNATSAPGGQWQIPNAAIVGLSFVGFALLWSVTVFSAMRFYVVSFVTGVWYFKASGMAAQRGGSGTVTNPVTTATKLAFTKSFGTICLTGLIMYIVELLRRMAKKQSQNNGLAGVLIACCINCLVAYLEFITRFALTLHALTGDDLCTSARTFTSHLNRHGFSAVWVNWMASWVFNFSAFALSLLITAICLVITSHTQRGFTAIIVIGILSFIFAIVFLSFVAGILLNVIDACYSCPATNHGVVCAAEHGECAAAHGVRACAPHCQRVRCQVRPGSSPS